MIIFTFKKHGFWENNKFNIDGEKLATKRIPDDNDTSGTTTRYWCRIL